MIDTPTAAFNDDNNSSALFVLEEGGYLTDVSAMTLDRKKTLLSVPVLLQTVKERDNLPQDVWDDILRNSSTIYFSLTFLSAAVMWPFYSCLSAQDFYSLQFPENKFTFLTTVVIAWPQVLGHITQLVFGLNQKIPQSTRFITGFVLFMAMAVCIMLLSAIQWENQTLGASLVLVCMGITGLANSMPQSVLFTMAAVFPLKRFTNAVQIGSVTAGVFNVTLNTILRLLIGGVHQTAGSQQISFYLFFTLLLVVCIVAIIVYQRLMRLLCMQFLLARSAMFAAQQQDKQTGSVRSRVANHARVFKLVAGPAIAQFVVFFVTRFVYPGVGCAADRVLHEDDVLSKWYCAPGIIGTFNYGDCIGRVICTAAIYRTFTMKRSLILIMARIVFIPLLLVNVHGSSLYVFGDAAASPSLPLMYGLVVNMLVGLTGGLLGTVTMSAAPLLVGPEDREAASSVMVLFMFLGVTCGSSAGYVATSFHLFGL